MKPLKLSQELCQVFNIEFKKLGVRIKKGELNFFVSCDDDFPPPAERDVANLPQTHISPGKIVYFENDLNNLSRFRSITKHELYHLAAGHLERPLSQNNLIAFLQWLIREWEAILYQYLNINLLQVRQKLFII